VRRTREDSTSTGQQPTAAGVGHGHEESAAGRVETERINGGVSALGDVDRADALSGDVDDDDVDAVIARTTRVDALAVRAGDDDRHVEGEGVLPDDVAVVGVDHGDRVVPGRGNGDEGAVVRHRDGRGLAGKDAAVEDERVGVENGDRVVAEIGHHDGVGVDVDVGDRATPYPDRMQQGDVPIAYRDVVRARKSVSHVPRHLRQHHSGRQ
jgi:hypothetical protein